MNSCATGNMLRKLMLSPRGPIYLQGEWRINMPVQMNLRFCTRLEKIKNDHV